MNNLGLENFKRKFEEQEMFEPELFLPRYYGENLEYGVEAVNWGSVAKVAGGISIIGIILALIKKLFGKGGSSNVAETSRAATIDLNAMFKNLAETERRCGPPQDALDQLDKVLKQNPTVAKTVVQEKPETEIIPGLSARVLHLAKCAIKMGFDTDWGGKLIHNADNHTGDLKDATVEEIVKISRDMLHAPDYTINKLPHGLQINGIVNGNPRMYEDILHTLACYGQTFSSLETDLQNAIKHFDHLKTFIKDNAEQWRYHYSNDGGLLNNAWHLGDDAKFAINQQCLHGVKIKNLATTELGEDDPEILEERAENIKEAYARYNGQRTQLGKDTLGWRLLTEKKPNLDIHIRALDGLVAAEVIIDDKIHKLMDELKACEDKFCDPKGEVATIFIEAIPKCTLWMKKVEHGFHEGSLLCEDNSRMEIGRELKHLNLGLSAAAAKRITFNMGLVAGCSKAIGAYIRGLRTHFDHYNAFRLALAEVNAHIAESRVVKSK